MIDIKNEKDCCGCSACSAVCPKQCISMVDGSLGHLFPSVDSATCIDCGLCEQVCPMKNDLKNNGYVQKAFAAYSKCDDVRFYGSSGGMFGYLPGCDVKAYVHTGENSGVSSGEGKIRGENALFEYKKTFFAKLTTRDVNYIKVRHYAVLAFAYLRMRKLFPMFKNAFLGFVTSPIAFIKLLKER